LFLALVATRIPAVAGVRDLQKKATPYPQSQQGMVQIADLDYRWIARFRRRLAIC
jgi:hypothetical protein